MTSKTLSVRRLVTGFVLAFVTAGILHGAVWLWACGRLRAGYQDAVATAVSQGWSISAGPTVRSGWPWAAAIELPAVTASGGEAEFPGGIAWEAERVVLRLPLAQPTQLLIRLKGRQTVQAGALPPVPIEAGHLSARVALDGAAPPALSGSDLVVALPSGPLRVRSFVLRATEGAASLEAQGVVPIEDMRRALGAEIDGIRLRAILTGPTPPPGPAFAGRARRWRDAGGTLNVPEIAMRWSTLAITGHAVMRLDAQLQPEIEGTLDVTGHAQALDAMARAGLLPGPTAMAAKAVLALLAAPARGGPISLPVQVREGILVVARFPLLRLPKLDWGPP